MDLNDLKKIKFYVRDTSKDINAAGARYWLKTFSESQFPKGIKVKVEVKDGNVKISKKTSGTMILWKDYETEFKVKDEKNGNYSLENVVNMNEIVKQVGIENGNCDDENGCTIGEKINIYISGTEYRRNAGVSVKDRNKKITYRWGEMTKMKFKTNLAFRVPKGGIELDSYSGSDPTKNAGTFNRIKEGNYEIRKYAMGKNDGERDDVPYLSKHEPNNYNPHDEFFA